MPVLKLSQTFIDHELNCPEGKTRIEFCDIDHPGLYVLASVAGKIASFFLRYKNANGKTCHQKIGRTTDIDLAEARKRAKALKAEITLGADPRAVEKARKEVLTFADYFENHYIPYVKPRKRSWQRDNELYTLRIKAVFGLKRLNQITRQQIQTFHTELLAEGLAPATCDHHVKLIKHALFLAIDWGLLTEKNPAARIPLFNVPNSVQNTLSDEQISRLYETLKADKHRTLANIVTVLLGSGARVNEVLQAKWVHIDRVNKRWHVPTENSKSKKPRIIEITDVVLEVINSLTTEGRYDYLFVNQKTRLPYTTIKKPWIRLRAKAGLPHLRLHDCRHLFITWVLESGASLFQAGQLAGHMNPATTQKYAHLSKCVLQSAANNGASKFKRVSQSSASSSSMQEVSGGDAVTTAVSHVPA